MRRFLLHLHGESMDTTSTRSEIIAFKVTPAEKLTIVKRARRTPYRGNISALLRDLLRTDVFSNDKPAVTSQDAGGLVTNN